MSYSDEARRAQNEYYRNWRKKNPDKVKAAQARYWQKKAEKAQDKGAGSNE
jgi:hypothetical protein